MPHWRDNHESDSSKHFRSADLFDDVASEKNRRDTYRQRVVEIVKMSTDLVKSRDKPRGERRNFAHFAGIKKPFGLNVTNCETLEALSGTSNPERWVGLRIAIYVDPEAKYPGGKKGPAIRIRPNTPTGPVDRSPLAEVPPAQRERLDKEHDNRLEREPGEDG